MVVMAVVIMLMLVMIVFAMVVMAVVIMLMLVMIVFAMVVMAVVIMLMLIMDRLCHGHHGRGHHAYARHDRHAHDHHGLHLHGHASSWRLTEFKLDQIPDIHQRDRFRVCRDALDRFFKKCLKIVAHPEHKVCVLELAAWRRLQSVVWRTGTFNQKRWFTDPFHHRGDKRVNRLDRGNHWTSACAMVALVERTVVARNAVLTRRIICLLCGRKSC